MGPPSYSGSTWTSSNLTNDEDFSSLANWNYGFSDDNTSGSTGNYYPWGASGTAPYWGSLESTQGVLDYDLPGNVFQTSTGADTSLYSTYSPQAFHASGWGVSIAAHYTGSKPWNTQPYGTVTETWTSGAINSYNKISFPSGGHTSCFVQIKAQMMGYQGSDNGAWDALWFLGQGNEQREIDLQETGLSGQSPSYITSHLQTPAVEIASTKSGSDLSAGYHVYGMQLANQVVSIYLDNKLVGTATSGTTGPYFLLMNGTIASGMYGAAPANNVDMTMNVMEVQVYQQ
jgi:Glycosyl hydrolases family 16